VTVFGTRTIAPQDIGGLLCATSFASQERPVRSEQRLRQAYQGTQFLLEAEAPDTVRAWFMGMDPYLDDQAPALVLRDDPAAVLRAARAFRAGG
jgi:hypothetical protein